MNHFDSGFDNLTINKFNTRFNQLQLDKVYSLQSLHDYQINLAKTMDGQNVHRTMDYTLQHNVVGWRASVTWIPLASSHLNLQLLG